MKSIKPPSTADYLVPDMLRSGLKLVLCGTAPSPISAAKKAYYANPGNQFWPVLARTGLTPRQLTPSDYPSLPELGIGLTDLCKTVAGSDHELPGDAILPAALTEKILQYQPRFLAFTSKQGALWYLGRKKIEYGLQPEQIGHTQIFVLPSTSGRARTFWREDVWQELAAHIKALR